MVGKTGVLDNKSGNISEMRKDRPREKVSLLQRPVEAHHITPIRTVPSPTPYGLPFSRIEGLQPPPKTPIENCGNRVHIEE